MHETIKEIHSNLRQKNKIKEKIKMNDDIEIKIRIIPVEDDNNSDEVNEILKNQILNALSKSFYKGYTMEKLEKVTTLSEGDPRELPELSKRFEAFNNQYKSRYKNKNRRRRR